MDELPLSLRIYGAITRVRWWVWLLIVGGALTIVAGFFHVVNTARGVQFCPKESWGLSSTFVDVDDLVDQPLLLNLDRAPVIRALARCGLLGTR